MWHDASLKSSLSNYEILLVKPPSEDPQVFRVSGHSRLFFYLPWHGPLIWGLHKTNVEICLCHGGRARAVWEMMKWTSAVPASEEAGRSRLMCSSISLITQQTPANAVWQKSHMSTGARVFLSLQAARTKGRNPIRTDISEGSRECNAIRGGCWWRWQYINIKGNLRLSSLIYVSGIYPFFCACSSSYFGNVTWAKKVYHTFFWAQSFLSTFARQQWWSLGSCNITRSNAHGSCSISTLISLIYHLLMDCIRLWNS